MITLKLIAQVNNTRPLRSRVRRRGPRHQRPKMLELDYLAEAMPDLRLARELITQHVLPQVGRLLRTRVDALNLDAGIDIIGAAIDAVEAELNKRTASESARREKLDSLARRTDTLQSRELTGQIKEKLGLDIVAETPGFADRAALFTRQNVRLIKSIPTMYMQDVEQTILRAVRSGMRAEDLAAVLEDRYSVASNRAALIAQDQVGKFYGEVAQERQRGLGIDGYIWRNVGDERVAGNPGGKYPDAEPSHWDRDGESFKWSDPPEGGHPGQRPRCRCWAEPDLEGLL